MKKHLKILAIAALAFVRCGHTDANSFSKVSNAHRYRAEVETEWAYPHKADVRWFQSHKAPARKYQRNAQSLRNAQNLGNAQSLRSEQSFEVLDSANLNAPKASTNL